MNNFKLSPKILMTSIIIAILYSLTIKWVIEPYQFFPGGVAGISTLLKYLFDKNFGIEVPLGLFVLAINIPILYVGAKGVSIKFVIYTLVSVIVQTIVLSLPVPIDIREILGDEAKLTAAIMGGALVGAFLGFGLKIGSSGGGTDVLFQYLSLKKGISIGSLNTAISIFIVICSGFITGWELAIYTVISFFMTSIILDKVHTSYNQFMLEIVTQHADDIAPKIFEVTGRGCTVLNGYGSYLKEQKQIIHTVFNHHQLKTIIKVVTEVDSTAFITMLSVKRISGSWNRTTIT